MRLADLQLGEAVALKLERQRQPLGDVERLEQVDLLREREIGAVARGVGQRAGVRDRSQEGGDALVGATHLEDLLDDRAIFAVELTGAPVHRNVVGMGGDVHAKATLRVALRSSDETTRDALERHAATAAGHADGVYDLRDRADLGEVALLTRHEQDGLLSGQVHRQGKIHGREDHGVVEGDEKHLGHYGFLSLHVQS